MMLIATHQTAQRPLAAARAQLENLPALTGPGLEVSPVVTALAGIRDALVGARPELERAGASTWLLSQVDRVAGATRTLGESLAELAQGDGMTKFDQAFADDDPSWDRWFVEAADIVRRAEGMLP